MRRRMATTRRSPTLILDLWLKPDEDGRPDPTMGTMRYGISDVDPEGKGFTCHRTWIPGLIASREYRKDKNRVLSRLMKVSIPTTGGGRGNIKAWDLHATKKKQDSNEDVNDIIQTAIVIKSESDNPDNPNDAFNIDTSEFEASVLVRMAQDVIAANKICKDAKPHDESFTGYTTLSVELQKSLVDLVEIYVQQKAGDLKSAAGYPLN
jgi:hypothetical protein